MVSCATARLAAPCTSASASAAAGVAVQSAAVAPDRRAALARLGAAPHRLSLRAASAELRRLWPIWAWLTFVAIGYIAIYAGPAAGTSQLVDVASVPLDRLVQAFVPASLGIVQGRPAHVNALVASAAQVGLALLIIVTIWTRRRAWRAWALLGIAFVANTTFVGWDRAVLFNLNFTALTATDLRYQVLLFALLLIVVVIAIAPPGLGGNPPTPAARPRRATGGGRSLGRGPFVLAAASPGTWPPWEHQRFT